MQRVTVLSWDDSNMAGYEWGWEIFVTKRKDGTFSTGALHISKGPPTFRLRGSYRLRNGAQIKEAIESLFSNDELQGSKIYWDDVVESLRTLDSKVADEVQDAIDQETDD